MAGPARPAVRVREPQRAGPHGDPTRALAGYLEWRVDLLMVGYYGAYALVTREQTTRKRLVYFCLGYVLMLTALSPMYAFVLLVNSFRFMTILHLCLGWSWWNTPSMGCSTARL